VPAVSRCSARHKYSRCGVTGNSQITAQLTVTNSTSMFASMCQLGLILWEKRPELCHTEGRVRVDDFLADILPRLRETEIALHSGDAGPRKRSSQASRLTTHVPVRFSATVIERVKELATEDGKTVRSCQDQGLFCCAATLAPPALWASRGQHLRGEPP
jgi:hypothetical protein